MLWRGRGWISIWEALDLDRRWIVYELWGLFTGLVRDGVAWTFYIGTDALWV